MAMNTERLGDRTRISEGGFSIDIVNLRAVARHACEPVDRRTPLGNPYVMHREEERDEVCTKFHRGFIMGDMSREAYAYLERLELLLRQQRTLQLGCWCAPKRCHAESLARTLLHRTRDLV